MSKGVADLHRRSEVSQKANERYLEALTVVDVPAPLRQLVQDILKPVELNGRRIRALRALLFPTSTSDEKEEKRRSSRVTRLLRMLRAHGLIKKVPRSHRYHLTEKGRKIISAFMQVRDLNVDQLARLAA